MSHLQFVLQHLFTQNWEECRCCGRLPAWTLSTRSLHHLPSETTALHLSPLTSHLWPLTSHMSRDEGAGKKNLVLAKLRLRLIRFVQCNTIKKCFLGDHRRKKIHFLVFIVCTVRYLLPWQRNCSIHPSASRCVPSFKKESFQGIRSPQYADIVCFPFNTDVFWDRCVKAVSQRWCCTLGAWARCRRLDREWALLPWGLLLGILNTGRGLSSTLLSHMAFMWTRKERYFPPAMPAHQRGAQHGEFPASPFNINVCQTERVGLTFDQLRAGEAQHARVAWQVQATGQPHWTAQNVLLMVLQKRTQHGSYSKHVTQQYILPGVENLNTLFHVCKYRRRCTRP